MKQMDAKNTTNNTTPLLPSTTTSSSLEVRLDLSWGVDVGSVLVTLVALGFGAWYNLAVLGALVRGRARGEAWRREALTCALVLTACAVCACACPVQVLLWLLAHSRGAHSVRLYEAYQVERLLSCALELFALLCAAISVQCATRAKKLMSSARGSGRGSGSRHGAVAAGLCAVCAVAAALVTVLVDEHVVGAAQPRLLLYLPRDTWAERGVQVNRSARPLSHVLVPAVMVVCGCVMIGGYTVCIYYIRFWTRRVGFNNQSIASLSAIQCFTDSKKGSLKSGTQSPGTTSVKGMVGVSKGDEDRQNRRRSTIGSCSAREMSLARMLALQNHRARQSQLGQFKKSCTSSSTCTSERLSEIEREADRRKALGPLRHTRKSPGNMSIARSDGDQSEIILTPDKFLRMDSNSSSGGSNRPSFEMSQIFDLDRKRSSVNSEPKRSQCSSLGLPSEAAVKKLSSNSVKFVPDKINECNESDSPDSGFDSQFHEVKDDTQPKRVSTGGNKAALLQKAMSVISEGPDDSPTSCDKDDKAGRIKRDFLSGSEISNNDVIINVIRPSCSTMIDTRSPPVTRNRIAAPGPLSSRSSNASSNSDRLSTISSLQRRASSFSIFTSRFSIFSQGLNSPDIFRALSQHRGSSQDDPTNSTRKRRRSSVASATKSLRQGILIMTAYWVCFFPYAIVQLLWGGFSDYQLTGYCIMTSSWSTWFFAIVPYIYVMKNKAITRLIKI